MKIVTIVQARLGSTRFPKKILQPLVSGKAALECMLARVQQSKKIDMIVLAIPDSGSDDELARFLDVKSVPYFRGSEDDVLDRYYQCAKKVCAPDDIVVRLTSDCPVIDPDIIDKVIGFYLEGPYHYVSNSLEPYSWPDGMDVEVFSFKLLERAAKEATLSSEREHVTFYFWKHPEFFKIGYLKNKNNQSAYRLTLDYPEDYELLKNVYEHFMPRVDFTLDEILDHLDANSAIKAVNANVMRNAGWQKALEKDKKAKKRN